MSRASLNICVEHVRARGTEGEVVQKAWHVRVIEEGESPVGQHGDPGVVVLTSRALVVLSVDYGRNVVVGHDKRIGMERIVDICVGDARPHCLQVELRNGLVTHRTEVYQVVVPRAMEGDPRGFGFVACCALEMRDALLQVYRCFNEDTAGVVEAAARRKRARNGPLRSVFFPLQLRAAIEAGCDKCGEAIAPAGVAVAGFERVRRLCNKCRAKDERESGRPAARQRKRLALRAAREEAERAAEDSAFAVVAAEHPEPSWAWEIWTDVHPAELLTYVPAAARARAARRQPNRGAMDVAWGRDDGVGVASFGARPAAAPWEAAVAAAGGYAEGDSRDGQCLLGGGDVASVDELPDLVFSNVAPEVAGWSSGCLWQRRLKGWVANLVRHAVKRPGGGVWRKTTELVHFPLGAGAKQVVDAGAGARFTIAGVPVVALATPGTESTLVHFGSDAGLNAAVCFSALPSWDKDGVESMRIFRGRFNSLPYVARQSLSQRVKAIPFRYRVAGEGVSEI